MYAELSLSQLAVYTLNKVFAREESTDSHWPAFIKPDQLDPWIKESIETQPPVYNFVSKVAKFYARWLALSFRNVTQFHNSDVKSPASRLFTQPFNQAQIKKNPPKLRVTGLCVGNLPVTNGQ